MNEQSLIEKQIRVDVSRLAMSKHLVGDCSMCVRNTCGLRYERTGNESNDTSAGFSDTISIL